MHIILQWTKKGYFLNSLERDVCKRDCDSFYSLQFIQLNVNGSISAASKNNDKFIGVIDNLKKMSSLPLLKTGHKYHVF